MSMETDSPQTDPIDVLTSDDESAKLSYIIHFKHTIIGNKSRKMSSLSLLPRIISVSMDPATSEAILSESMVILASYCYLPQEARTFFKHHELQSLFLSKLGPQYSKLTAQHAIYALMSFCKNFPEFINTEIFFQNDYLSTLISHLGGSVNSSQQTARILQTVCSFQTNKTKLLDQGVIPVIAKKLFQINSVRIHFLELLACLLEGNIEVSKVTSHYRYTNGVSIPELLTEMIVKEIDPQINLSSAHCLVSLFLGQASDRLANIATIKYKVIPRLVSLSKPEADSTYAIQRRAIGVLSRAVEFDLELQLTLSETDQFINVLTDYLKSASEIEGDSKEGETMDVDVFIEIPPELTPEKAALKSAIFQILSQFCSEDDSLRRVVSENRPYVMEQLVRGLMYENHEIKLNSINCLLSLSRSVKQLRTSFVDYPVWRHVLKTASPSTQPIDIVIASYSLLTNLVLEFSPAKEELIKADVITRFHSGLHSGNQAVTELSYWGLMNSTFMSPPAVKTAVKSLPTYPQFLFTHLSNPVTPGLTLRSLGILRNILSTDSEIDEFLQLEEESGLDIVFTVTQNYEMGDAVREQALCVLANISSGSVATKKKVQWNVIISQLGRTLSHCVRINWGIWIDLGIQNVVFVTSGFRGYCDYLLCVYRCVKMRRYESS